MLTTLLLDHYRHEGHQGRGADHQQLPFVAALIVALALQGASLFAGPRM